MPITSVYITRICLYWQNPCFWTKLTHKHKFDNGILFHILSVLFSAHNKCTSAKHTPLSGFMHKPQTKKLIIQNLFVKHSNYVSFHNTDAGCGSSLLLHNSWGEKTVFVATTTTTTRTRYVSGSATHPHHPHHCST